MADPALLVLAPGEAVLLDAIFERMFPDEGDGCGASAAGVVGYVDRALAGAERDDLGAYRRLLGWFQAEAERRGSGVGVAPDPDGIDVLIAALEAGQGPEGGFALLRRDLVRGLFSDPAHGGNRGALGWRFLGHPGPLARYSAEEQLSGADLRQLPPRTLADWSATPEPPDRPDPDAGRRPPLAHADIVIVGGGAVGLVAAWRFALAGLATVVLEAGPWRSSDMLRPDELSQAFYGRAGLGPKFNAEAPRWVRREGEADRPLSFSLGRMANGVGGSSLLYGARFRRFLPHHFRHHSFLAENGALGLLPEGAALADWPLGPGDLSAYYDELEALIGVAGEPSPLTPRASPLPHPPLRPSTVTETFRAAAERLGYRPYSVPVGRAREGRDAYNPWDENIGAIVPERWTPLGGLLPQALATGNLDLRPDCRVLRVLTDAGGRARGVSYLDAAGIAREQAAGTVILAAYTYENVRLLALSGTGRRPDGLGNTSGQLGRRFMAKMFPQVIGQFSGRYFNRHTGPGGQAVIAEDLMGPGANLAEGHAGGGTLSTENQFLPLQIGADVMPADRPGWGAAYKQHLRDWNSRLAVKIQADALPLSANRLVLDPRWRDRSGVGDPVIRVVWDLNPADRALYLYMQGKAEALLEAMGAGRHWRGPVETGVGCCHDLGGCCAGEDPRASVVDPDWQVHDTPGLYVFGGATFPTCPGINPTLTIWAWALRNADRIVGRLGG